MHRDGSIFVIFSPLESRSERPTKSIEKNISKKGIITHHRKILQGIVSREKTNRFSILVITLCDRQYAAF